jgi:phage terminase Nu1 subunit (DNA packaging protein)
MGNRIPLFRHDTLTGREFVREMTRMQMSERELSKLTGARARTIDRWKEEGPPFHVRLLLELLEQPGTRKVAHTIAERHMMEEDEYREAGAREEAS